MPTSIPNFNFLARLVSEIWGGSQNKKWELLISPDAPLADKFLHFYMYLQMLTRTPNFNFLALIVSEIKRVSQNLMWGYHAPAVPRTLKLLRMLQVLGMVKQPAKFQRRISMHHAVVRICISHRLSIVCAQKCGFWGFWGWRCENSVF